MGLRALFAVLIAIALSLTMPACSSIAVQGTGNGDAGEYAASPFNALYQGRWRAVQVDAGKGSLSEADMALLDSINLSLILVFEGDQKLSVEMGGKVYEGITGDWEALGAGECTVRLAGFGEVDGVLSDSGELVFEQSGAKLVFARGGE